MRFTLRLYSRELENLTCPVLPSARLISNTHFLLFKRLPLTRKESHAGKT